MYPSSPQSNRSEKREQSPWREPTYQWHEDVEDLECYQPEGYHPVHIDDLYSNGRYRIIHKLGIGSYSTVWLARDLHMNRYIALKIIVAEASEHSSENRVWQHLQKCLAGRSVGGCFVASMLDEFYIDGPNGRHLCLASEPARCSVAVSKEASMIWMFPLNVARAIAAQSILGVQAMHENGVIHGDLHVRNILLTLPAIDTLSVDEIYEHYHTPRTTTIERLDGAPLGPEAPRYSVIPAQLPIASDEVTDPRICISDFGEAWHSSDAQPKQELNTPVLFLPPEVTFDKTLLGFPADIWALACSIYEIMGERPLFEGFMPDRDDILAEMVSALGPLPQPWWDSWKVRGEFFNENGAWGTDMTRGHDAKSRPLLLRIQEMGRENDADFLADEIESLEKMMRAMLEYEPSKRATIKEVLASEWMLRWGYPSLQRYGISG